jgi:Tol biopolymer transport system component
VSSNRSSHRQGQIYIFDLANLKERRLTYQDGECSEPFLSAKGQIFYSSTTDELKERPSLLNKTTDPAPFASTEIYQSDFSGNEIKRWTDRPGFDGQPWMSGQRNDVLFFLRAKGADMALMQMDLKSGKDKALYSK